MNWNMYREYSSNDTIATFVIKTRSSRTTVNRDDIEVSSFLRSLILYLINIHVHSPDIEGQILGRDLDREPESLLTSSNSRNPLNLNIELTGLCIHSVYAFCVSFRSQHFLSPATVFSYP